MLKIMIVGAASGIAHATARSFAADGASFFLVGRDAAKLDAVREDLNVHGAARVETYMMDANAFDQHQAALDAAIEALDGLDAALIAHGTLTDQAAAEANAAYALQELNTNFMSTASLCTILANHFEAQRRGHLAVISSVAGDRGRGSNYVYGTAKAALTAMLQGLRNRLHKSGVKVLTIKPGFVETPMTAHLKKGLLWVKPEVAGRDIYNAMKRGQDVLYTPRFWRLIMLVIMNIPEAIFKRLSL